MKKCYLYVVLVLCISGCAHKTQIVSAPDPNAKVEIAAHYRIPEPISCVPYARDVSGIQIRGNAHTWWGQAAGRFERGSVPQLGAVYVLSKSNRLKYGHVSVVRNIIDSRTIEVEHSNWGGDKKSRSIIYKRMRVEDLSVANDWSSARFWNYHTNAFGSPYIASGFIYPI